MIRLKWIVLCLTSALVGGSARAQATVFWTGASTNTSDFDDRSNWLGGLAPANNGTQVLGFYSSHAVAPNGNLMTLDVNVNAKGLDIEADKASGGGANISIVTGSNKALKLGAYGITMNTAGGGDNFSSVAAIAVDVTLSANQTWSLTNSDLDVTNAISEGTPGTRLTIDNTGGLMQVTLGSPKSTFSGGLTLTGGPGTVLVVGADSTGSGSSVAKGPVGTGTLTLGNGVDLTTPPAKTITLGNNIVIGNGPGASTATIQGALGGDIILKGAIRDPFGGTGAIQTTPGGAVDFEGNNTFSGGATFNSTSVTIGTDTGLGAGPVTANNSTLDFTSLAPGPSIPSFSFSQSTVDFSHGGASPTLGNLALFQATLNFSAGATISIHDVLSMAQSIFNFAPGSTITFSQLASDSAGSGNAINIANGSALTIDEDGGASFHGAITGPFSSGVTFTSGSSGIVDLYGANTYSGGTTIRSGALVIADSSSALGTGIVTINGGSLGVGPGVTITNLVNLAGGSVEGYGTLSPSSSDALVFHGPGFLAGGRGTLGSLSGAPVPGTLTFGAHASLTLAGGGTMQFSVMNATAAGIGVAGTDYSTISAPGSTVNITATMLVPFTIRLVSVDPATGLVGLANFDPARAYQWTLLSAATINGFAANEFVFDTTTDFQNSLAGGSFSIAEMGHNLVLDFAPVPEPSTWALMAAGLLAAGAAARRRRA